MTAFHEGVGVTGYWRVVTGEKIMDEVSKKCRLDLNLSTLSRSDAPGMGVWQTKQHFPAGRW